MATLLESEQMLIRLHHDVLTSVNAVQGDTGRTWNFQLDDYEIPKDAEIRMYIKKPSGKEIYNPGILNRSIISFQPTLQTLAEIGQSIGQIQIVANEQSVTTFPFFINVSKNYRLYSSISSADEFTILDDLIAETRRALNEIESLSSAIQTQEENRESQEQERQRNEEQRKQAEISRGNAENNRNTAEQERVSAEIERENKVTTALGNVNTAISNTNQATTKANQAAKRAEDAVNGLEGVVSGVINDYYASTTTTYSSSKINTLLDSISVDIEAITDEQIDSLKDL